MDVCQSVREQYNGELRAVRAAAVAAVSGGHCLSTMGAERRLLVLSALILVLVSAGVLAAPSGAPAEPPGQPDSSPVTDDPVTAPVTASVIADPVTAKTAPDQTISAGDGTEMETGRPTTAAAAGDTQSKLYGGSNCECTGERRAAATGSIPG